MEYEKTVDIQVEEKALKFIQSRRLKEPLIMVSMCTRSGEGGCDGGCGGGCGGEGSSESTPFLNVVMVDGGKPGDGFVKVFTQFGIPVYLDKAVYNRAKRSENPLILRVRGLVMKRLSLDGLDLSVSQGQNSQSTCH